MVIQRANLRDQVKQEILVRLASGELQPGAAVNEVRLAGDLGVSRTPLREALIALESDRVIVSQAGKGFSWAPISAHEFHEITPIIVALESMALELTPIEDLAEIADQLLRDAKEFSADSALHDELIHADDAWHSVLISRCPNGRLVTLIAAEKVALRRYERLTVPDDVVIARSAKEHLSIARALKRKDKPAAIRALHTNWTNGHDRLLDRLPRTLA